MGRVLAVAPDVLVLRALGLGDLLTAVPALRGVRRGLSGRIMLAAPAALAPLALLSGAVDEVVPAAPLGPLPPEAYGAELAVNLHGSGPQSTRLLLATAPARLVAYRCPEIAATAAGPDWEPAEHERHRWARLVSDAGLPADPDDLDLPSPPVAPLARGAVLLHPGAAYGSRRWPADRWAEVAGRLAAAGAQVLVTGSATEAPLARVVAAQSGLPGDAVLAGRTGLAELAALVAAARLVLSGDTGIAHLATAFGTPSVVLFGPASPERWRPPVGRRQHRVLWSGRTGDVFADAPDPGLLTMTAGTVLAEAAELLAGDFSGTKGARERTV